MRQGRGPLYDGAISAPNVRTWPMAVLAPNPKYTTDRYQKGAYADPHKNP